MILSGWKEIAGYLHTGVRTAQRWEDTGLPINRPCPGRRSHVVADSGEIDLWLQHSIFWRNQHWSRLADLARARKLRFDVQRSRQMLRQKLDVLRKEVKNVRAATERLQKGCGNERKSKAANQVG